MAARALTTFGGWDLTQPTGSPRSRLYSLTPMEVGTSEVESLTGYVARLADAHCVSPGDLIAHECKSLGRQPQRQSYLHQINGSTEVLNGTGQMANEFVQVLHHLTLRQDLRHLTLLPWVNVLPARGLIRRFHAWCPICYQEFQDNRQTIYDPLLWTLSVVASCPKHHRKLLSQCPHCDRQIPFLAWHSRPGYCSKCQKWLGSTSERGSPEMDTRELAWQTWVTSNVGELIAQTPDLTEVPGRLSVARSLSICITQTTEGNITEFARRSGLLKSAVSQWRSGKAVPQLSVLLEICRTLNVSLVDFLFNTDSLASTRLPVEPSSPPPKPQRIRREFEVIYLQQSLQSALEEEPPPTMKTVAQRLGYSARSIRRRFPALCSAVSARYLNYRDQVHLTKVEQCCQEIREVALMLSGLGVEPTRSQIAQYLKKPAYFRDPDVSAFLEVVREELGFG